MSIQSFGHSNLDQHAFRKHTRRLAVLADIRSHPVSAHDQFDQASLQEWEKDRYEWWPMLGGWNTHHRDLGLATGLPVDIDEYAQGYFPKHHIARQRPGAQPGEWTSQGLYDYSWYATLDEFRVGLVGLVERGERCDIGMFCSERTWWKCHRSIVSDALWVVFGISVVHRDYHRLWRHREQVQRRLPRYDPRIIETWESWR